MFTGIMKSKIVWSYGTHNRVTLCVYNTILSLFIDYVAVSAIICHLDVQFFPVLKFLHRLGTTCYVTSLQKPWQKTRKPL